MARPARGSAAGAFDLNGRTFVTVYDFMGQRLHLKGAELMVYARIFGFHQAGRSFYESKSSTAAFFGISDRAVFDAISRLKDKGLIEEIEPCREAVEIGSKCYRPSYRPLLEIGVTANAPEEAADAEVSHPEESAHAARRAYEGTSWPTPTPSEEAAGAHMNEVHPISKTDNKFFE